MPGTILENLSNYKLCILVAVLLSLQSMSFMVGFMTPTPANSQSIWATYCLDDPSWKTTPPAERKWLTRDCDKPLQDLRKTDGLDAENIVVSFEMHISKWPEKVDATLDIENYKILELIDTSLAYSDTNPITGDRSNWTYYAHSEEKRKLEEEIWCVTARLLYHSTCNITSIFELTLPFHEFYLINIRLPAKATLNEYVDLHLNITSTPVDYPQVFLPLKTLHFVFVLLMMISFCYIFCTLNRTPVLTDYTLIASGVSLLVLDFPIEYLSLDFNIRYYLLFSKIRDDVLNVAFILFCLVWFRTNTYCQTNSFKKFFTDFRLIILCALCWLILHIYERIIKITNPFYKFGKYAIYFSFIYKGILIIWLITFGVCSFSNFKAKHVKPARVIWYYKIPWHSAMYRKTFVNVSAITTIAILATVEYFKVFYIEYPLFVYTSVYGMWNSLNCGLFILWAFKEQNPTRVL